MGSDTGVTSSEGSVIGADGVSLFQRRYTPSSPPKGRLLMVHGLKDHSGRYAAVATRIAERGWDVSAFDLRGHGRSGGARQRVRHFDEYLTDLDLELQSVRKEPPDLPVVLFGHSMGGGIVARFVLERRPTLRGMVLSAPALKIPTSISGGAVGFTKFLSAIAPGARVFNPKNSDFSRDPVVVDAMAHDPLIDPRGIAARTMAGLIGTMETIVRSMESFHDPFLVMHGTADRLTNPAGSEELHRRASSVDKTSLRYDGLYHDLLHEPESERVTGDLIRWMDAHL